MNYVVQRSFRQQIVDVHKKLYDLGYSVANDGNTSVRLTEKEILITPMGLNKATLQPAQIVVIPLDGKVESIGVYSPSSERALHISIYKARPDVQAIVHAHPPYAIALSLAGVSLENYFLPEVITTLGQIPTVQYATPSTQEFGEVAAEKAKKYDALILDRHGAVTMGKTLDEALQKLERLEHSAKIVAIARSIGNIAPLPKPEVDRLLEISGQSPAPTNNNSNPLPEIDTKLVEFITREVQSALSKR